MDNERTKNIRNSYDSLPGEHVSPTYDELQHKPLDRHLFDSAGSARAT